ncbi:MAG: hypothetical protein ACFCUT_07140 [Kiloniellaceae bacterium]
MRSSTAILEPPSPRPARMFAAVPAVLLPVTAILAVSGQPAAAQTHQCAAREAMLTRLADHYHEEPVSIGITATGSLLEVLASPEGSWTIIITVPGGPTCLVSSGEGWRGAPMQVAEDPRV